MTRDGGRVPKSDHGTRIKNAACPHMASCGADNAVAVRVLHVTPFFAPAWVYGGLPESAVPVRAASVARGRDGSGADYGCERVGTAAGRGGDGGIRASRRNRRSLLRARRAAIDVARASRSIGGTDAVGRRSSSARGVLVPDDSNAARCASAKASSGMDSARRAAALERLASRGFSSRCGRRFVSQLRHGSWCST